jgi:hypothetical protein
MAIEFTVKSRFIIDGKEYGSVEDMPEEIRAAASIPPFHTCLFSDFDRTRNSYQSSKRKVFW